MPISSFSASKLADLIVKLSEPTIGLDTLRYDILPVAREIIDQANTPAKRVLAYVLWTTSLRICDSFDGEPMSEEQSQKLVMLLKGTVTDSVRLLASSHCADDEAIRLADHLIAVKL